MANSLKQLSFNQAKAQCETLRKAGNKIVFTNGCFDLLHPGHVDYLNKAKKMGDVLIVGINDDDSVQRLKGPQRPINNLFFRSSMLAALDSVDYVIPFKEDTPAKLIEIIVPNCLVKGGDYKIENIVGADFVKQKGGRVLSIEFLEGYSSSALISKIQGLT